MTEQTKPPAAGTAAAPAVSRRLQRILCLDDFQRAARAHLPHPIYEYIAGGAEDNLSMRRNREAFDDYSFLPRVMVDVSQRDTGTELFGKRWALPFGIAPMGASALSAYRGDLVLARAGDRLGVPVIMSGSSLIRLEEVAAEAPNTWFQAYLPGDTAQIDGLIARVRNAGFPVLVITVDTPVAANRENNLRAGFSTPLRPGPRLAWQGVSHPRWSLGTFGRTLLRHGMPHFENNYAHRGAPIVSRNVLRDFSDRSHFTWANLRAIREQWPGKLVVKGVLHPDDAVLARETGADGIIVSNHGGRQLDGSIASLRALPGVLAAVPGLPVMLDSGVRRGSDVLKALALGARMVFVGRPFGFAAAVGGEAGVTRAIELLGAEVSRNLAMLGLTSLEGLGPRYLVRERAAPTPL